MLLNYFPAVTHPNAAVNLIFPPLRRVPRALLDGERQPGLPRAVGTSPRCRNFPALGV